MITTLHIKNIGIIEDLTIDLNKGLNVLTGETGAGKTLIIDSLQIISGGRFSKDMIRRGENNSFVELCMYDPKNEKSEDGNIIVSREINLNGKNMCKINGRMVTVNELRTFMKEFIEIHGQNDNQNLLDNKLHLQYLDGFIGEKIESNLNKYYILYEKYNKIKSELKANYGDEKEKQRKLDLLKYQFDEIEKAELKTEEEYELEEKRKIVMNSEKISQNLQEAEGLIADNGIDSISMAIRALEKIENIDEKYEKVSANLKNIYYELQELTRDIENYNSDIYFDEEERNYIEERLDLIHSLKRKYGNTIEEILNYKQEIKEEINRIENLEDYTNKLKKELKNIEDQMNIIAQKMHEKRKERACKLSEEINEELIDLEMKNAKIKVNVSYLENGYLKNGKDKVVLTCDKPLEGDVLIMYAGSGSCIENQPQGLNHLQGHGNLRDSDSSKGFYKYIDLDGKNADGAYIYPREKFESRLRPDYEPKDDSGNIIYNQNYPLYNFCIGFYYKLTSGKNKLRIL